MCGELCAFNEYERLDITVFGFRHTDESACSFSRHSGIFSNRDKDDEDAQRLAIRHA